MLKKSTYLTLGAVLISLGGCATSPTELRNAPPDHRGSFAVQQGYESTYRFILERQRACEQANFVTAQMVVQGDLYPDTRSGTITAALHGASGIRTHTVIDVRAVNDQSSEVTIYSDRYKPAGFIAKLQKWISGAQECS